MDDSPLWLRIRRDIEERLANGEFDERFPSDRALTEHYGVSRHTVREAVRRLQEDGIITRRRGAGSFRSDGELTQPAGSIYSLFRSVEEAGVSQTSVVISQELRSDPEANEILGLSPGASTVFVERIRLADGRPLAIDHVHLPASIAAPLLESDFTHTALYDELRERCGVTPARGAEEISPVNLAPEDATRLGLRPGDAAFSIDRRTFTPDDAPLEWRTTILNGRSMSFRNEWSQPWESEPAIAPEFSEED